MNEARKFLFETYEVDASDPNVKKAIKNNGIVEVEFYDEYKAPYVIEYPIIYHYYHYYPWYQPCQPYYPCQPYTPSWTYCSTTDGSNYSSSGINRQWYHLFGHQIIRADNSAPITANIFHSNAQNKLFSQDVDNSMIDGYMSEAQAAI